MIGSEERDLREGLVYDPMVKGSDSNFWKGDTANVPADSVVLRFNAGSGSSYSQYLLGDFEFNVQVDSLSPDSNDSEKRWGLQNIGDSLERGAVYFEMRYDTVAGGDTATTRPLRAVARDEYGNVKRTNITWDTLWNNARTRYRIIWENDACRFLINDSVYATLDNMGDTSAGTFTGINVNIPQALRISNRTADSMDVSLIVVRSARKMI